MKRVFKDYAEMDAEILEGYTIAKVVTDTNSIMLCLEREISNGILGIEVQYNPKLETPFIISNEFVKHMQEGEPEHEQTNI